jgi:hypothetical protein
MTSDWQAGSEESAIEAGVIDALNGRQEHPPADFPKAYNWGFHDAQDRAPDRPRAENAIEAHQLAILGLVHVVIYADKDVDPTETAWLYEEARYHPVFEGTAFSPFRSACLTVLHDMHDRPAAELLKAWAGAARPHARAALELVAGAMLADGVVAPQEEGIVAPLLAELGVSRQEAHAVFREAFGLPKQ